MRTPVKVEGLSLIPDEWYIHRLGRGNLGAQFIRQEGDVFVFRYMSPEAFRLVCQDESDSLELGLTRQEVQEKIQRL